MRPRWALGRPRRVAPPRGLHLVVRGARLRRDDGLDRLGQGDVVDLSARPGGLRILAIAAELAGTPSGKTLAVLVAGLTTPDMARVLNAVQHAKWSRGRLLDNVVPLRRQYLHRYDYPLALGLLDSLIATRSARNRHWL